MDGSKTQRTPVDELLSKRVYLIMPASTDYGLRTVRNQQVLGSSPIAGSRFPREVAPFFDRLAARNRRWQRIGSGATALHRANRPRSPHTLKFAQDWASTRASLSVRRSAKPRSERVEASFRLSSPIPLTFSDTNTTRAASGSTDHYA
jgi:hypothetical protein